MNIQKIPISKIRWGESWLRESVDVAGLGELQSSISQVGLINPITVKPDGDGSYVILAGNLRFQALKGLGKTEIDAHVVEPKNKYEEFLIALHENQKRVNLTWVEEVKATLRAKELYEKTFPETRKIQRDESGRFRVADENLPPSFGEVQSRIRNVSERSVRRDIELAIGLEKFPQLELAPNKSTALKKLKQLQIAESRGEKDFNISCEIVGTVTLTVSAKDKTEAEARAKKILSYNKLIDHRTGNLLLKVFKIDEIKIREAD